MKIVALCGLLGYGYSEEALEVAFSEKVDCRLDRPGTVLSRKRNIIYRQTSG